jgi:hypothetical protein
MPQPDSFRDFGILPDGVPPPPEKVRSYLSRGRIVGQYIGSGLVSALGGGLAVLLVLTMPFPLNLLGFAAAFAGFGSVLYLATHNDYRWVELDGKFLRAKHLYTGRVIERSIEEIGTLATIVYPIRRIQTVIIETILGRVKGIEIRFHDQRTPMRVLRSDPAMTNAKELIEAVVFRMAQVREVDAEIIEFAGKPHVQYLHWKGQKPVLQTGKTLKLCLCCGIFLALMFGGILGFLGGQEQRRHLLSSVPPQEFTLQSLIESGPGTNPHVALTDFRFGGYVVETKRGSWTSVWIAVFPTGKKGQLPGAKPDEPGEIKAVLKSKTISNEAALKRFMQQGRITGLCSDAPGFTNVRGKLTEANPGSDMTSAWIIDDLSEPPSAGMVNTIFLGSAACQILVIALALVVFKSS